MGTSEPLCTSINRLIGGALVLHDRFGVGAAGGGSLRGLSAPFPRFRARLSHGGSWLVEDQVVHVVGEIGERDVCPARKMPMARMNSPVFTF